MTCSYCGHELHRDSGIAYSGYRVSHLHRSDCTSALRERISELERENAELRKLVVGAAEELRLIRMKDCDRVYDPTLRSRLNAAMQSAGERKC